MKNLKNNEGSNNPGGSYISTETSNLDLINEFNDKLANKVSCDDFDKLLNEIANLHNRIDALNSDGPKSNTDLNKNVNNNLMSSKDSNVLKDISGKVNDLESLIRKLQKFISFFIL